MDRQPDVLPGWYRKFAEKISEDFRMITRLKKSLKQFVKSRNLLQELVVKGIRLKYRRSYLGIIWSLLEPILMTIVLTIVFGTLLGKKDPTFPLYILCGRLLYSFFSSSTKGAAKAVRSHAGMIRKVYVPKYMYPLSGVLSNYVIFLISLVVIVPLCIYCKVTPTWRIFLAVIPLLVILFMSYGVGLILATIDVFFRDIEYLWDVLLMVIMYTSAIFYDADRLLGGNAGWLLRINPMYGLIANFRNCIYGRPMNLHLLLYGIIFSIVVLVIGHIVFYRKQDEFILYL